MHSFAGIAPLTHNQNNSGKMLTYFYVKKIFLDHILAMILNDIIFSLILAHCVLPPPKKNNLHPLRDDAL